MAIDKEKVLAGREAVDAYRTAHAQLHSQPWHKGIPEEHTPLLEKLLADLKNQGFNSLDEFWEANKALNEEVFWATYRAEGECDGCPDRERGCSPSCFAEMSEFSEIFGCPTLKPNVRTTEAEWFYIEKYGLPKANGEYIPNCKHRLVKVKKPDVDWRWK